MTDLPGTRGLSLPAIRLDLSPAQVSAARRFVVSKARDEQDASFLLEALDIKEPA